MLNAVSTIISHLCSISFLIRSITDYSHLILDQKAIVAILPLPENNQKAIFSTVSPFRNQMGKHKAALSEFPEIEGFLRMHRVYPLDITCHNQAFTEDHLVEVDSSFFDFFSVRVLKGDPKNLLNSPRKVVLSNSTAEKYFGDEDPIDKVLKIGSDTIVYTVTGVMADIPESSHFKANIISSL